MEETKSITHLGSTIQKASDPIIRVLSNKIYLVFSIILLFSKFSTAQQAQRLKTNITAFTHTTIYTSPADSVINEGLIIIKNDSIIKVGKFRKNDIPKGARIINCNGMTIMASFWNSHVHFTDPAIGNAKNMGAKELEKYLENFLTRYGFTQAFDIASLYENTNAIRERINSGEIKGPLILTTGETLVPEDGTPFYVKQMGLKMPEVKTPEQTRALVTDKINHGADAIKLFTGSPAELGKPVKIMPLNLATEAVKTAHSLGKPVFAHPSVNEGLEVALNAGVDILAHTTPDGNLAWPDTLIKKMVAANMYVIPTFKLWKWALQNQKQSDKAIEEFINVAITQVKDFTKAGGKILFGTDLGFIDDFDPTDEYLYMQKAGLGFRDILASLTTTPSTKFGFIAETGMIKPGMKANMTIVLGNPEKDIRVLTNVQYTIRNGKIIYEANKK